MSQPNKDAQHDHSSSTNPKREHPSTYFMQDRSSLDEMERLRIQDQLTTTMMGGVLAEQPHPERFEQVLDVGCGTGGWLIEVAKQYPTIKRLVGIDISATMLTYAREQATAQGVSDRVEFRAMDAIRLLEFPTNTFDLVNQRLAISWLRKWDWPNILREYLRVCQMDGVIRITESETLVEPVSPARTRLYDLTLDAFYQAGHFFIKEKDGVTSQLAPLLKQYGLQAVQTQAHTLIYSTGTPEGQLFYEDLKLAYRNVIPFLRKWTRLPDDYEDIYQQMLAEMQQPDFVANWNLLTAWGTNADRKFKTS